MAISLAEYRQLLEEVEDLVAQYVTDRDAVRAAVMALGAALQDEGEIGEGEIEDAE